MNRNESVVLLLLAALASAVWLLGLANRYKLFRWTKP